MNAIIDYNQNIMPKMCFFLNEFLGVSWFYKHAVIYSKQINKVYIRCGYHLVKIATMVIVGFHNILINISH